MKDYPNTVNSLTYIESSFCGRSPLKMLGKGIHIYSIFANKLCLSYANALITAPFLKKNDLDI